MDHGPWTMGILQGTTSNKLRQQRKATIAGFFRREPVLPLLLVDARVNQLQHSPTATMNRCSHGLYSNMRPASISLRQCVTVCHVEPSSASVALDGEQGAAKIQQVHLVQHS
jgi:hypothetical protein